MGNKVMGVGKKILSGVGSVGSKILDGFNATRDFAKKGWQVVQKIPVIGDIAQKASHMNIPIINRSLSDITGVASDVLDDVNRVAGKIKNRDMSAISDAKNMYDRYKDGSLLGPRSIAI